MAFYNDGTFQSMITLMVMFGLAITLIWYISKIIYALFCFDIRKIYSDTNTDNTSTNDTIIIDSIVQVDNPFQESAIVIMNPQSINNMEDIENIPIAEQV
jgi:hypothetical protein